ncbi:MAG: T9SS type A sorting domain-containing protein [Ignavibacteria bacterium]|jgi:hypothetical protein|nr:T9SS type A sorting domain-containing protein [Ignavibacteria bacterium]
MKKYLINKTLALLTIAIFALAVLFSPPMLQADIIYCGPVNGAGVPTSTTTLSYWIYPFYMNTRSAALYTASEIDVGSGQIFSVAFYVSSNSFTSTTQRNLAVLLQNTTATNISDVYPSTISRADAPTAPSYASAGWTVCWNGTYAPNVFTAGTWYTFTFTAPFEYTGGNLAVCMVEYNAAFVSPYPVNFVTYPATNQCRYIYYDSPSGTIGAGTLATAKPNMKIDITTIDHTITPSTLYTITTTQANPVASANPGRLGLPIICTNIKTNGDLAPAQTVNQISFDLKSSTINLQEVRLYYSGDDGTFSASTATLLGAIPEDDLSDTVTFDFAPIEMPWHGNHNFWLVYDVSSMAACSGMLDAKYLSCNLYTTAGPTAIPDTTIKSPNPDGGVELDCDMVVGNGTYNTAGTNGIPFYYYYGRGWSETLITKAELEDAGMSTGSMTALGLYMLTKGTRNNTWGNFSIKIANTSMTQFPSGKTSSENANYQTVYSATSYVIDNSVTVNSWLKYQFIQPFQYEGDGLLVFICYWGTAWGGSDWGFRATSRPATTQTVFRYDDTQTDGCGVAVGTNVSCGFRLDFKFTLDSSPDQKYLRSNCYQVTGLAGTGATNVAILGTNVYVSKGKPVGRKVHLKSMTLDGKGSFDSEQITNAKLWYTPNNVFATNQQVGGTISVNTNNIHSLVFTPTTPVALADNDNYFWLTYDISTSEAATDQKTIDAKLTTFQMAYFDSVGVETLIPLNPLPDTVDPVGTRTIRAPLSNGVYYVGAPAFDPIHTYSSLAQCATEFTQIGVTTNTEIRIISSLTETQSAVFGPSPFGDNIVVTMRPHDGMQNIIVTNASTNGEMPLLSLNGIKHFHIEGSNSGASGTTKDLTLRRSNAGVTVSSTNGTDITINNVKLIGPGASGNVVNFNNVTSSSFTNNELSRGNYGIYMSGNSASSIIENNLFGDPAGMAANTLGNGIGLINTTNVTVRNNKIINIVNSTGNAAGIKVSGPTPNAPQNISIIGNYIRNVSSAYTGAVSYASAFEVDYVADLSLLHNTVHLSVASGQRYTAVVFNRYSNTASLIMRNNLFSNTLFYTQADYYSTFFITPLVSSLSTNTDYNVYNGTQYFLTGYAGTSFTSYDAWKLANGQDAHSNVTNYAMLTMGASDAHLDGEIVGMKETLVPVISEVMTDIDGPRGADVLYPGMTTVGVDEVMFKVLIVDSTRDLPAHIIQCEDSKESLLIGVDRKFDGWNDGIERTISPIPTNIWVGIIDVRQTEGGDVIIDTLTMENGGYRTDFYPYIYIKEPTYSQSCSLKVYTTLGYYENESSWCKLDIVKLPEFLVQPLGSLACIDGGETSVTADIYGSYTGVQWEKLVNGVWTSIVDGQKLDSTTTLTIQFPATSAGAAKVTGQYRLKIFPFEGICGAEDSYYSQVIEMSVGYPLTAVEFYTSLPIEELKSGVCSGEPIWLSASVPEGSGTVTGYQWQRFDAFTNEFIEIPAALNPTAITDTFRIISATNDDRGEYRCLVLGVAECPEGATIATISAEINVNPTSSILQQPADIRTCIGTNLVEELMVKIAKPTEETINLYQWYKDGVEYFRTNEDGQVVSPSDTVYSVRRTDTTYLPFELLTLKDAGKYKLRMIYTNCQEETDTLFSDEVNLYVFGEPQIISQSNSTYGMRGGFVELHVNVVTSGSDAQSQVKYKWYRHYSNGYEVPLTDGAAMKGTSSPYMIINPLTDIDINDQTTPGADYYFCEITDLCGNIRTDAVMIKIAPEIKITSQPVGLSGCENTTVTFSVTAQASEPGAEIGFQWYHNGAKVNDGGNVTGSQTNSMTVTDALVADAGDYYCEVYYVELGAAIYSSTATLNIEGIPTITSMPPDTVIVNVGAPLQLSIELVEFPGAAYEYQWYLNDIALPNTDASSYYVASAQGSDSGVYLVRIVSIRGCGEVMSKPISVIIVDTTGSIIDQPSADFGILSVLPNPVTNEAIVNYVLPTAQNVTLKLMDITGNMLATLYSGIGNEGANTLSISEKLNGLSSGTYIVLLEANGKQAAYHITLSK